MTTGPMHVYHMYVCLSVWSLQQDDSLSSEAMSSHSLTSSSLMSRDIDDMSVRSVTSSLLEEFSPGVLRFGHGMGSGTRCI